MNKQSEKDMTKDVEENEEMYQALADKPDKTIVKVPTHLFGFGYAVVTIELDEGVSDLLDEQFVKKKAEGFAQDLSKDLQRCREIRNG